MNTIAIGGSTRRRRRLIGGWKMPLALSLTLGVLLAWAASASPDARRQRFRVDVPRSRFTVNTETTGLSSMFGHDHRIDVGNYEGTVTLTPGAPDTATLDLKVWADSLRALGEAHEDVSWDIDTALQNHVLETGKYPAISFVGRAASARRRADGAFDIKVTGTLQLHGVRREVTVPLRLQMQTGTLRASGAFTLRQTDYKITPFSFGDGAATVANVVTLSFDIVAQELQPQQRR